MSDLTAAAALSSASVAGPEPTGSTLPADLALPVPSAGEAAEFARAAAASMPEQMQAVAPATEPDLGQTFAQDFDGFIQRVNASQQAFGTEPAVATPSEQGSGVRETIERSLGGMQTAYAFAIETTMASRGSTETTKVFNTLLKGQ